MAETFYGPWQIVTVEADEFPTQGFLISGSDGMDGRYVVTPSAPVDMLVTGDQWSLDLQLLWPTDPPVDWTSMTATRKMAVLPLQGLTVEIGFQWFDKSFTAPFFLHMRLHCICKDPAINPTPATPPEITLPGLE